MNGTTRRTRRSIVTKAVHREMPDVPYREVTAAARRLGIEGGKDAQDRLLAALREQRS